MNIYNIKYECYLVCTLSNLENTQKESQKTITVVTLLKDTSVSSSPKDICGRYSPKSHA